MEEHELLRRLDRVTAPADFEARVSALLARRRADRPGEVRSRIFRTSLAGAAAALLATFVLVNGVFLRPGGGARLAERRGEVPAVSLPVMETVGYRNEARDADRDAGAVYILENVSFASNARVRY